MDAMIYKLLFHLNLAAYLLQLREHLLLAKQWRKDDVLRFVTRVMRCAYEEDSTAAVRPTLSYFESTLRFQFALSHDQRDAMQVKCINYTKQKEFAGV